MRRLFLLLLIGALVSQILLLDFPEDRVLEFPLFLCQDCRLLLRLLITDLLEHLRVDLLQQELSLFDIDLFSRVLPILLEPHRHPLSLEGPSVIFSLAFAIDLVDEAPLFGLNERVGTLGAVRPYQVLAPDHVNDLVGYDLEVVFENGAIFVELGLVVEGLLLLDLLQLVFDALYLGLGHLFEEVDDLDEVAGDG